MFFNCIMAFMKFSRGHIMLKSTRKQTRQKGIALVLVLIFVTVFSMLSVTMFTMASGNIIAVDNVHTSSLARSCAQSGLETIRYYTRQVSLPGSTETNQRFTEFAAQLQDNLADVLSVSYDEVNEVLTIGSADNPVELSNSDNQNFYATITPDGTDGITVSVTGNAHSLERTIAVGFSYDAKDSSVFDYGVATKGPMYLGSLSLEGVNSADEADIYIESLLTSSALEIKNAQLSGDVSIRNSDATVSMTGSQSSIGGVTGISSVDDHVQTGVSAAEFPIPNPTFFEQYVDGITIDALTDTNFYKQNVTLENVRIAANTDPKFTGGVQIVGILYIESPNVVEFSGNCDITGMIVAEGDYTDNSGDNRISFKGTVSTESVEALPADSQFDGLRDETGTFLMAPGFSVSFGGNFDAINGCIAANGITFFGNAGGQINGTIINYSDETMELAGGDLFFNKSGTDDTPAGFALNIEINYIASTYEELH